MIQSQRKRHVAAVVGGVLPENDGGENDRDESSQTEPSKASGDPAPDAMADTASPDGDAAVKESKSAGKPTRKKGCKKTGQNTCQV